MDPKLASKASGLLLATCKDLRRYDTTPLVLSGSCRNFAAHFLKLLHHYHVPALASSSSKFTSCVIVRLLGERKAAGDVHDTLDKILERVAGPETMRERYPLAFSLARTELDLAVTELDPCDKALFADEHKRTEEWSCVLHKSVFNQAKVREISMAKQLQQAAETKLWLSPMDRIGLIALIVNDDPKIGAFVASDGVHSLPPLVFEMLSIVPSVCWEHGEANPFVANKHHLNNGGMLAVRLCSLEYKLDQHPLDLSIQPLAALSAMFTVLCRIMRVHGVRAHYFDGLLLAAGEYFFKVQHLVESAASPVVAPRLFPECKGVGVKEAYTQCLQRSVVAIKELTHQVATLADVFRGVAWDDDIVHEAIDRGLWLQRLVSGEVKSPDAVLKHDEKKFKWRQSRFRSLSFASAETLLMRHGHNYSLARIRFMRAETKKAETPYPLVFVELVDIHAANAMPSLLKVMRRDRFWACTYLSDTDNHYNTLLAVPTNLWAAYQAFSSMEFLSQGQDADGRDVTRLPFAPLLYQMFTTDEVAFDYDGARVVLSVLGDWIGLEHQDPVDICSTGDDYKRLLPTQTALQFLLGASAEPLPVDISEAQRWADLVLVSRALLMAVLKPNPTLDGWWTEICSLVVKGYYEHSKFVPLAEAIVSASSPAEPLLPHNSNTTYEHWYEFQRKAMRPRVTAKTEGGCNHSQGCGESFYRFLVQTEMEMLGYSPERLAKVFASLIDEPSDEAKALHVQSELEILGYSPMCAAKVLAVLADDESKDKKKDDERSKLKTADHVYHGCLSMFDPPLAFVRPEMDFVYATSQVYFSRRDYDQVCDLSDSYHWFEWCFLDRFSPEMLAGFNAQRKAAARPTAPILSPRSAKKRAAPQPLPKPLFVVEKARVNEPEPRKKARVDANGERAYEPQEMYSPTSPQYDPSDGSTPTYSATSPSYSATSPLPANSPCSPQYSPLRPLQAPTPSFAERQRQEREAKATQAREEQRLTIAKAFEAKNTTHLAVQQRALIAQTQQARLFARLI